MQGPVWITEREVVSLLSLGEAIDPLARGVALEARGHARNMPKTVAAWGKGHNLHAIGAVMDGFGLVGTKTWAHTAGGACPLLILFDTETGALRAVIEAFALGQMRTAAVSGVATRALAADDADELAVIGSGKQALPQVAAVHAVRPLRRLRVYSPRAESRERFAAEAARQFGFEVTIAASVEAAVADAPVVTLVTRATEAFLSADMLARGTHVNAVGAITPERQEFAPDVFLRTRAVVVDSIDSVQRLSREFMDHFGRGPGDWSEVRPLASVIAGDSMNGGLGDLTLFKAMGMGISDLALGAEILERARASGAGRPVEAPQKVRPRLV